MKRLLALGLTLGVFAAALPIRGADDDKDDPKEALKALQDFIGNWKGTGGPDKPRPGPSDPIWSEAVSWGWRFKGDDAWLVVNIKDGKYFNGGQVRYLPSKKCYQLTALSKDGKTLVFEGQLKNEILTLERTDPQTREMQQLKMNSAAEGVRLIYRMAHKDAGTTLWKKDYVVALTKEGESLATREKKTECVVSGGLGTIPIAYKGETFYVCCSGCADAFRENPEKYIAEYKAKKNKK